MISANTNWKLALPQIARGPQAISPAAFCFLGALLLHPFLAQASSVTLNLGPAAQNLILAGLGANGSGLGTYNVTLGTCTPSGGNTTCILSGSFTGASPGFTSGTYSLATFYLGTGPSALLGVEQGPGSNFFNFSGIPFGATMTLTLGTSNGTIVVPILSSSHFLDGVTLGFLYDPLTAVCSGTSVSTCSVSQVGVTTGAVITGPPVGTVTFNQGNNYYYSQLVYGFGWQMTLTLVNYSPQTVTCVTNFYSDMGTSLPIPFGIGTVSSRTDVLAPGQSIHDQSTASLDAMDTEGWGESVCTGPVQASVLYRLYQSGVAAGEAGVNAEVAPTTEFATFAQTATGIAYANPSTTQSATITVKVVSAAGSVLGSTIINLGPLAHGSHNLGPLLGLQSFTGSVEIISNIPIITLSLNAEAFPVFSSLPAGDLPDSTPLAN